MVGREHAHQIVLRGCEYLHEAVQNDRLDKTASALENYICALSLLDDQSSNRVETMEKLAGIMNSSLEEARGLVDHADRRVKELTTISVGVDIDDLVDVDIDNLTDADNFCSTPKNCSLICSPATTPNATRQSSITLSPFNSRSVTIRLSDSQSSMSRDQNGDFLAPDVSMTPTALLGGEDDRETVESAVTEEDEMLMQLTIKDLDTGALSLIDRDSAPAPPAQISSREQQAPAATTDIVKRLVRNLDNGEVKLLSPEHKTKIKRRFLGISWLANAGLM